MGFRRTLFCLWPFLVVIFTPLLLLPLPILWDTKESRCAYGVILMSIYWLTEAIPIPVTGFIPFIVFPMMGVAGVKDLAKHYIKDTNLVFMGGLIMAVSLEHSMLHKRIGLTVLKVVGTSLTRLLTGFMLATWFLSLWISNTATTAMMIPVINAVLIQIKASNNANHETSPTSHLLGQVTKDDTVNIESEDADIEHETVLSAVQIITPVSNAIHEAGKLKRVDEFAKMMCLSVAIAANIGGTATLTGSGTNLVLYEMSDELYSKYGKQSPINFSTWLPFGIVSSIICLFVAWFWLQVIFIRKELFSCPRRKTNAYHDRLVRSAIKQQYDSLGNITFAEISNIVFFCILLILWLTRDPGFVAGWTSLFPVERYVTDSVPVFLLLTIMFIFPAKKPDFNFTTKSRPETLLNWQLITTKVPWGPILTLGGGFAMAEACKISGLTKLVSDQLAAIKDAPLHALLALVVYFTVLLTQIAPNIPSTTLSLPLISALAEKAGIPPLQLMFPANLAASYAFTLPVSTPPNAIVFSYGYVKSVDMAKTGFVLALLCSAVVILVAVVIGPYVVDMEVLSALTTNSTITDNIEANYTRTYSPS